MIRQILYLLFVGLIMSGGSSMASDSKKEAAAIFACEKWLTTVDSGQYALSWKETAHLFKNAISQEQWEHSLQMVRQLYGKIISRKVQTKSHKTSLPGAPDGEYFVIVFKTSFENKKNAMETVTPLLEKDGQWRVSGYYIK